MIDPEDKLYSSVTQHIQPILEAHGFRLVSHEYLPDFFGNGGMVYASDLFMVIITKDKWWIACEVELKTKTASRWFLESVISYLDQTDHQHNKAEAPVDEQVMRFADQLATYGDRLFTRDLFNNADEVEAFIKGWIKRTNPFASLYGQ